MLVIIFKGVNWCTVQWVTVELGSDAGLSSFCLSDDKHAKCKLSILRKLCGPQEDDSRRIRDRCEWQTLLWKQPSRIAGMSRPSRGVMNRRHKGGFGSTEARETSHRDWSEMTRIRYTDRTNKSSRKFGRLSQQWSRQPDQIIKINKGR